MTSLTTECPMSVPDTAERDPEGQLYRDALPEMPSSVYPRPADLNNGAAVEIWLL